MRFVPNLTQTEYYANLMRPLSASIVDKFATGGVEDRVKLREYKRAVLQEILQRGTPVGKLLQVLSLFFVMLTIIIYVVETTDHLNDYENMFKVIESVSVAFFTMELVLTLMGRYKRTLKTTSTKSFSGDRHLCCSSPVALLKFDVITDILAVLPFYFEFLLLLALRYDLQTKLNFSSCTSP